MGDIPLVTNSIFLADSTRSGALRLGRRSVAGGVRGQPIGAPITGDGSIQAVKLNLGCGRCFVDGWINVDYSLGAHLASVPMIGPLVRRMHLFNVSWERRIVLHDLRRPLPWPDGSVDVAYASHTLEHLLRDDGHRLLEECHRVLRPNGILRILVPDLRSLVRSYTRGSVRADNFIESLGVLYERSGNPIKTRLYRLLQFPHQCMYDEPRLLEILDDIGFDSRGRAGFDSGIDDIQRIELEDRTRDAVIVEGQKR